MQRVSWETTASLFLRFALRHFTVDSSTAPLGQPLTKVQGLDQACGASVSIASDPRNDKHCASGLLDKSPFVFTLEGILAPGALRSRHLGGFSNLLFWGKPIVPMSYYIGPVSTHPPAHESIFCALGGTAQFVADAPLLPKTLFALPVLVQKLATLQRSSAHGFGAESEGWVIPLWTSWWVACPSHRVSSDGRVSASVQERNILLINQVDSGLEGVS